MAKRPNPRQQAMEWFDRYYWFEHYRCCDQKYEIADDAWSKQDLDELKESLLDRTGDLSWDVHLYLEHKQVGTLRVDLGAMFDAVSGELRYQRTPSDGTDRRLTESELNAPLTPGELDRAVTKVAQIADELFHESDLPGELYQDMETVVPSVNEGPASTLRLLRQLWDIEGLRSRRLRRALYAIGSSNSFQELSRTQGNEWRAHIEDRNPYKLRPVGVSTRSVQYALGRLIERSDPLCRPGRPRKVDRSEMPIRFRTTREELRPFHQRLRRLHSPGARGRLRQEFPPLSARLEHKGLLTRWINGPCPSLDDATAELLAAETGLTPQTAKRYGKAKPGEETKVRISSAVNKSRP